jgi:two-component system, chemotaxis family, protein-glutamate methylesterase/glutaminase
VKGLPTDLGAAICIVLHVAPGSPSMLAHILGRAGPLSCRSARDGERLRQGVILVARPTTIS